VGRGAHRQAFLLFLLLLLAVGGAGNGRRRRRRSRCLQVTSGEETPMSGFLNLCASPSHATSWRWLVGQDVAESDSRDQLDQRGLCSAS